jgi:predicted PurR-regulated permease PerM
VQRPYRVAAGILAMVVACGVGLWLIITLRTFLVITLIAGLFAAALDRPVNWAQRNLHLKRRGGAIAIVFFVGLLLLVGLGYSVYRPVNDQSASLRRDFPERVERLKDLPVIGARLKNVDLKGATDRFFNELPKRLRGNRELVLGVAQTALTVLALTATTIVIAVFMLLNGPRIADGSVRLIIDPERAGRARRLGRGVLDAVAGYVLGNLLISLLASIVVVISLVVMRVPFVAVLAAAMFILDLIPLVGATLGGVVVTGAIFVLDPHPWKAFAFVVVFVVYQQIENHTIYPVVMGRTVKIGAFPVFLVTLAGSEIAGILGALLAIPIGAAVNVVIQDYLNERRRRAAAVAPLRAVRPDL